MSLTEKAERRKSAEGVRLSKSQSIERRSRTSSGSRKSLSKKVSTECGKFENQPAEHINYAEEVVLIFYDFLLKGIVQEWTPVVEEIKKHEVKKEEDVKIKDFKELTSEDLQHSHVVAAKAYSQVSLAKKHHTTSNVTTQKSLHRVKSSKSKPLLMEGDNISVATRLKKKPSEKFDRHKRRFKNQLDAFSSATFITLKSEEIHNSKEWLLKTIDEQVIITFKNGNVYEGTIHKKAMHGLGKFWWADGAYYKGEFLNGSITGKGKMVLPDLSYYHGNFCDGLFHKDGVFCIGGSSMVYSGGWKYGKKHGKGWLLYGPNNWYDGEWFEGKRHGFGIRRYTSGAVYEGMWEDDVQSGEGSMAWHNNDFYKGSWKCGMQHGYGEYTWNAFFNKTLTFPVLNTYQGSWVDGKRNGIGLMHFGTQGGAKLAGVWKDNLKHGAGILVCGNGRQIQNDPLFLNDKPIQLDRSLKTVGLPYFSAQEKRRDSYKRKASLQVLAKQISSKQPQKKFENINLKLKKETNETCNSLDIPLHSVPEQVSFEYCIWKVLSTTKGDGGSYGASFIFEEFASGILVKKDISTSKWNAPTLASSTSHLGRITNENRMDWINSKVSFPGASGDLPKVHYVDLPRYQYEEKNLRHCVTTNLQQLKQIYDKYATICSMHTLDFKPTMVRMFLWQLWRDLGIVDETTSLCDINLMLNENPYSGYETVHCPFEKIYYWQFLQALVAMSWFLLLKFEEPVCTIGGTLANCFRKFLEQYFSVPKLHVRTYSLFEFKDLLPIDAVYRLYRKLGEPHSARDFLKATCVRKSESPPCYLKTIGQTRTAKIFSNRGFNSVPVGLNVTFLPEETEEYQAIETIEYEDPLFDSLITFRSLGIKTVVKCLAEVCPQICQDGIIVTIDYPLSFSEFYEVLLLCAFKVVEKKQKAKEAPEQLAKVEEQPEEAELEQVAPVVSDRKFRKSSKEKKKYKTK